MTPEFACDLACGDVPQNHRLIGATRANLAVVIGSVRAANEICHTLLSAELCTNNTELTHKIKTANNIRRKILMANFMVLSRPILFCDRICTLLCVYLHFFYSDIFMRHCVQPSLILSPISIQNFISMTTVRLQQGASAHSPQL